MQYSPKLKKATEEIKMILLKYDIAASIVLHTPGHSEFLLRIDPSYSIAKLEVDHVRIKANLQRDFNGDKKKMEEKMAATSNMLRLLAETAGKNSIMLFEVSDQVDKVMGSKHTDEGFTSHDQQNN